MPPGIFKADARASGIGEHASVQWFAASVDMRFYTAPRPMKVLSIQYCIDVVGSDGGGCSVIVRKCTSGTVITSGVAVATSIDLKNTAADTSHAATLATTAGYTVLAKGDSLALDFTGTLTAATGNMTVQLVPVGNP